MQYSSDWHFANGVINVRVRYKYQGYVLTENYSMFIHIPCEYTYARQCVKERLVKHLAKKEAVKAINMFNKYEIVSVVILTGEKLTNKNKRRLAEIRKANNY